MKEATIKCIWCNVIFDSESITVRDLHVSLGCDTCGDASYDYIIEIHCPHCKKLVYKKEVLDQDGWR